MQSSSVLNCMFETWYNSFKNVTFQSECLDLPADFISYLYADGLVLPKRASPVGHPPTTTSDDSDNEINWSDEDEAAGEEAPAPSFPELDTKITTVIERLGGAVLPKLNWSSPKDAGWIALNHTLKCSEPNDVYLLLKSSNFIMHDLTEPFKNCIDREASDTSGFDHKLVLRAWHELNVGMEFRCFVKDNKLIGISQRYHTSYFDYLQHQKDKIIRKITNFYEKKVHTKFADHSYVFDAYIDGDSVYLVDFNPFGRTTDALLFTWQGLETMEEDAEWPEFRYNKDSYVQGNVYQQFTVPQDFVDLASGTDPSKLYDLLHLKIQSQNEDTSSDGESFGG